MIYNLRLGKTIFYIKSLRYWIILNIKLSNIKFKKLDLYYKNRQAIFAPKLDM